MTPSASRRDGTGQRRRAPKKTPRRTKDVGRITFRASPVLKARVDELAEAHGGNRSKAIVAAILKASKPQASDVPNEAEVLRLLGEAARSGNVSAMKELRAYHREHSDAAAANPFSEFDELAARRAT